MLRMLVGGAACWFLGMGSVGFGLGGCVDGGNPAGPTPPSFDTRVDPNSCEARWEPRCEHLVDRELVPYYRRRSIEPILADSTEFCRRLAIDLIGRIPTADEMASCESASPDDAITAFMATDDYVDTQTRFWMGEVGHDTMAQSYHRHTLDLLELVSQFARAEITYDEFAASIIIHPAFLTIYGNEQWGAGVFRLFLGRRPRPDEEVGMQNLAQVFDSRGMQEGRIYRGHYDSCFEGLSDEAMCHQLAVDESTGVEYFVDFSRCAGFGCATTALGFPVSISGSAEDYEPRRLIETAAGEITRCPSGGGECPDYQHVLDYVTPLVPLEVLPPITETQLLQLLEIGLALVSRGDFWEYAVDRELLRLLGWWQQTLRQPDYDLPAVRRVLAVDFAQSRDIRDVQRSILTSHLYRASIDAPTEEDLPPWATGPLKLMAGETWVRSASQIAEEYLGVCELPLLSHEESFVRYLRDRYAPTEDFPEIAPHGLNPAYFVPEVDYFVRFAQELGGCKPGRPASAPNLSIVASTRRIATQLCAIGRGVVPEDLDENDSSDANLDYAASHLMQRIFSREPSDSDTELLRADLRTCLDSAPACTDVNVASRWLCVEMLSSSRFTLF